MSEDAFHQAWAESVQPAPEKVHPPHRGHRVQIGSHVIRAAGARYLRAEDIDGVDLLVPLTGEDAIPFRFGRRYAVLAAPLVDFGGVPAEWPHFVAEVAAEMRAGKTVLAFCHGGHGRTGCLLASLIAVMESPDETPDPVAATRERHCPLAVETLAQAEAAFALRGEAVPDIYVAEFRQREQVRGAWHKG